MLAAVARLTQLRARITEIKGTAPGSTVEPSSLAGAIAEQARLERLLSDIEDGAIAVPELESELAPMVIRASAAHQAGAVKLNTLAVAVIVGLVVAWLVALLIFFPVGTLASSSYL